MRHIVIISSHLDKFMDFLELLNKLVLPFLVCVFGLIIVTICYRAVLNTTLTDVLNLLLTNSVLAGGGFSRLQESTGKLV